MAKKTPKSGGAPVLDIWSDEHLAEAPAKNSAAVQLSEKWVHAIRNYTKIAVWSSPVMALLLLVIYSGMGTAVIPKSQAINNQVDSAGKSAAILAENAWMGAVPSPLDGGKITSWNGFDVKKQAKVSDKVAKALVMPDYTVEIHHFTLTDSQGIGYTSDVAVAVNKVSGAAAISSPSLTPIAPSADGFASQGAWFGLKAASASESVNASVAAWAKAFTAGNPTVLLQTVGDPATNHAYMPLTGVSAVTSDVIGAGQVPVLTADGIVSDAPAKTLIVQVQLQLTWGSAEPVGAGSGHGSSLITYDLLVEKSDTAAPVVVAWGGAGSGPDLKPYGNAIVDRSITIEGSK
jgi:hypothetical protein